MTTSTQTTDTNVTVAAKTTRKPRASYRLLSHFEDDLFGLKVETVEQGKVTDTLILWSPLSIDIDEDYSNPPGYVNRKWIDLVLDYSAVRFALDTRKDCPPTLSETARFLRGNNVLLEAIDASVKPETKGGKAAENLQLALLVNELRAELAEARKVMSFLEQNSA